MKRVPVTSEMLKTIAYDQQAQALEVVFANGSTYTYEAVPQRVFNALLLANGQKQAGFPKASVGNKFISLVRNSGYSYQQV